MSALTDSMFGNYNAYDTSEIGDGEQSYMSKAMLGQPSAPVVGVLRDDPMGEGLAGMPAAASHPATQGLVGEGGGFDFGAGTLTSAIEANPQYANQGAKLLAGLAGMNSQGKADAYINRTAMDLFNERTDWRKEQKMRQDAITANALSKKDQRGNDARAIDILNALSLHQKNVNTSDDELSSQVFGA